MKTTNRSEVFSLVLFGLGIVLGGCSLGVLIADIGPPTAVRYIVAALPFTIIPFAIGWLAPRLWLLGLGGTIQPMLLAAAALLTGPPPASIQDFLMRWPLFLPLPLSLAFAYLGRLAGRRRLQQAVESYPPQLPHSE